MVQEITDESEFNSMLSSNNVAVVYYFASWSTPCRATAPKFDEISEQHPGTNFVKVDVDELSEVAETWGVNCMPTFIVYKEGQVSQKIEGADFDRLRSAITDIVSDEDDQIGNTANQFEESDQQQENHHNTRNTDDGDDEEEDERGEETGTNEEAERAEAKQGDHGDDADDGHDDDDFNDDKQLHKATDDEHDHHTSKTNE